MAVGLMIRESPPSAVTRLLLTASLFSSHLTVLTLRDITCLTLFSLGTKELCTHSPTLASLGLQRQSSRGTTEGLAQGMSDPALPVPISLCWGGVEKIFARMALLLGPGSFSSRQ